MNSEFRQDLVSGAWVLIATGRSKKPHAVQVRENNYQMPQVCPFEDPQKSGNGEPVMVMPEGATNDWSIQVISNKYPAVAPGVCTDAEIINGYKVMAGNGYHEVVVLRDHDNNVGDLSRDEVWQLLYVYRERYRFMSQYDCGDYIIIFHNYGREAGATLYHPHSQILSMPILPPDVMRSISGAEHYYAKFKKEVYGVMIQREIEEQTRIVYENEFFIAFCPYVSKIPYEVRIYPRVQKAHFEETSDNELRFVADALGMVLRKIKVGLNDPAYNFFIHTSPVRERSREHTCGDFYRWHIEITPRIKFAAGFEAGTGIELNIVDPNEAASKINGAKIETLE